ncbi:alcohol oxidase [Exidia glandulosa HHB12029]|uniref:Alcohol oxidase n=1 Tax=Exidia glandulosa HHB12029 TaxID=1314781 RepID=A0A165B1J5_EXIGL|nr:alcohol oxidase [Exidia glandulosa HHB12029]
MPIYETTDSLPSSTFDFVVVGAGAAGSVLAHRLSEDTNVTVLLLEAGPAYKEQPDLAIPSFCRIASPFTQRDWKYMSTEQKGLNGRVVPLPRGRVVGGSTALNTGDDGWSWDKIRPYMEKNEKLIIPVDEPNPSGGREPVELRRIGINYPQPYHERLLRASDEVKGGFAYSPSTSVNSGHPHGLTFWPTSIKNGTRSSAASAYLTPEVLARPNLHLLVNAHVARVVPDVAPDGRISCKTVEYFLEGQQNHLLRANAQKDLILSPGAFATPAILMRSGFGNKEHLASIGIQLVKDVPALGKRMIDHPWLGITLTVDDKATADEWMRDEKLREELLHQWQVTKSGPLSAPVGNLFAQVRLPEDSFAIQKYGDTSSEKNTPNYFAAFCNGFFGPPRELGNYLTVVISLLTPISRGSLTITSADPLAATVIDCGYLTEEHDVAIYRTAIRDVARVLRAEAWKDYVLGHTLDGINLDDDAALDTYIRSGAMSLYHNVATARMDTKSEGPGVVESKLRVKDVDGLRIVDASVLPFIPAATTQAPVYVVAERAADLIKSRRA